jgi:hypothetical protein
MQVPASRRATLVWGVLSLMTIASWLMARARGTGEFSPSTAVTVGILAVAATKSRLIIRHFMEVRAAPRWLRGLTDGWLVLLAASILALYLW